LHGRIFRYGLEFSIGLALSQLENDLMSSTYIVIALFSALYFIFKAVFVAAAIVFYMGTVVAVVSIDADNFAGIPVSFLQLIKKRNRKRKLRYLMWCSFDSNGFYGIIIITNFKKLNYKKTIS
jgi:hypothetical protein